MADNKEIITEVIDDFLLDIMVCPQTKEPLILDKKNNELVSKSGKWAYPIRNGIPILLAEEARENT